MNPAELSGLRYRVCTRKIAMGRNAAMKIAARARADGERITAYRCPFHDDDAESHWHIGHPATMATLERIAELLRDRTNVLVPEIQAR